MNFLWQRPLFIGSILIRREPEYRLKLDCAWLIDVLPYRPSGSLHIRSARCFK